MIDKLLIREISEEKDSYLELLLIGDEQEEMVMLYLNRCRLFIAFMNEMPVACIATTEEAEDLIEVKNLAVVEHLRRKGIGKALLNHIEELYAGLSIQLGTGETPSTLRFYHNCGYRFSHRIPDFFTDNYDHPIVEEGVLLKDMLYLCKHTIKW